MNFVFTAVMMALRNLQEKIFQLEKEKNEALSHLHDLGRETSQRTAKTSPFNKINTSSDLANLNDISGLFRTIAWLQLCIHFQ